MEFIEVKTALDVAKLIKRMPEIVAVDTEYVPGNPRTTKLATIIISDGQQAWLTPPDLLPSLTPALRARKLIFLQDYNHCDTVILYKHGCDIRDCNVYNLIDMHHLLDENSDHSLGARILAEYGDNYKKEFWSKYDSVEDAPHDERLEYEGKDGIYTYRLGMRDLQRLEKEGLLPLYYHVRRKSRALLDTELKGVRVDEVKLLEVKTQIEQKIAEYLPALRREYNEYCNVWELQKLEQIKKKYKTDKGRSGAVRPVFSFASTQQISWLVYDALKYPVTQKTEAGNPTTSYEVLKALNEEFGGLQTYVKYVEDTSIYTTFVKGIHERVDNGRIYPHFNVSGTKTGRISHSDPNLGNLPTDGPVRSVFMADEGYSIIGADYSQLEVLIEANLTHDAQLLKIINEGESKHDITARGLGLDRGKAKTLNFALQYGAGANKVSKLLGIGRTEAQDVFDRYWKIYAGVKSLKDSVAIEVDTKGYVTNLVGRVRRFPKVNKEWERAGQHRQAYNFLIQGVAAYVCNEAYSKVWEAIKPIGGTLWSVHDEIVCQVKDGTEERGKDILKSCMLSLTKDLKLTYPLQVTTYGPTKFWQKG